MELIPLEEFVAKFGDPDPWAVHRNEWNDRINGGHGVPEGVILLLDPEFRDMERSSDGTFGEIIRRIDAKIAPKKAQAEPEFGASLTISAKLGIVIRFRRVLMRLSSRQLAGLTRLTPSTMSRIEGGTREVTVDELEKLARALDSTPAAMLERARSITF